MGARIRGHYRIDAAGRIEAVCDVNSSLQSYVYQPPMTRNRSAERRSQLLKIAVGGISVACVGLILMASLPQIQNAVVASEAAHFMSLRRSLSHSHSNLSSDRHCPRPIADE